MRPGFIAAALIAATIGHASAETDWPVKPVTVIIPWAAGGGTDPLARIIFDDLSKSLGQNFVLDFRPGAAGTIGSNMAAKSEPDGYTLLFTSSAPAVNANFMSNVAYDPKTDIVPVIQVTYAPSYVVANAKTPYNTFEEMVAYAKANPGKVNVAHNGIGGVSNLIATTIEFKTGIKFNQVPYTGSGQQIADLLSGVVDLGVGFGVSYVSGTKAGKLKFLTVLANKRDGLMPDTPSSDESPYKGIYLGNWFMAFAPKGTPREIVDKVNAEIGKAIAKPENKSRIEALGYQVIGGTPEDAVALIKRDTENMKSLISAGVFRIE